MTTKYIKIYIKRNTFVFLGEVAVLPFVFVIYGEFNKLFVYCLLALIGLFLLALLPIIRFRRMIARQERLYNAEFCDKNVKRLEGTLYLSKDWLIWAGSKAIHKKHIAKIKHKFRSHRNLLGRTISVYEIATIITHDRKRYVMPNTDILNVHKIIRWNKRK